MRACVCVCVLKPYLAPITTTSKYFLGNSWCLDILVCSSIATPPPRTRRNTRNPGRLLRYTCPYLRRYRTECFAPTIRQSRNQHTLKRQKKRGGLSSLSGVPRKVRYITILKTHTPLVNLSITKRQQSTATKTTLKKKVPIQPTTREQTNGVHTAKKSACKTTTQSRPTAERNYNNKPRYPPPPLPKEEKRVPLQQYPRANKKQTRRSRRQHIHTLRHLLGVPGRRLASAKTLSVCALYGAKAGPYVAAETPIPNSAGCATQERAR